MFLAPDETRKLFEHAVTHRYAVLAVNADSPAAVTDCLIAAEASDAAILIEASLWQLEGHSFGAGDPRLGLDRYLDTVRGLAGAPRFANVPVGFHTDHIKGPATRGLLEHAMRSGASSISLDSSDLAGDENVALMSALCATADREGLAATLEMEAGVDDGVTPVECADTLFGEVERRHPGRLALWAPGVGTRHGLGDDRGPGPDPEAVSAHCTRASEIAGRPVGLALHGSSGVGDGALRDAVGAGVAKVNWSSESLLVRSTAARDYFAEHGASLAPGRPAMKETAMDSSLQGYISERYLPAVTNRLRVLGATGQGQAFLASL